MNRAALYVLIAEEIARQKADVDERMRAFTQRLLSLSDTLPVGFVPLKRAAGELGVSEKTTKRWASRVPGAMRQDAGRHCFINVSAVMAARADLPNKNADLPSCKSAPIFTTSKPMKTSTSNVKPQRLPPSLRAAVLRAFAGHCRPIGLQSNNREPSDRTA